MIQFASEIWCTAKLDSCACVYLHMHMFWGFFLLSEYKSVDDSEELVISAATAINNLSYYKVKSSAVQDKKLHIAESKDF